MHILFFLRRAVRLFSGFRGLLFAILDFIDQLVDYCRLPDFFPSHLGYDRRDRRQFIRADWIRYKQLHQVLIFDSHFRALLAVIAWQRYLY